MTPKISFHARISCIVIKKRDKRRYAKTRQQSSAGHSLFSTLIQWRTFLFCTFESKNWKEHQFSWIQSLFSQGSFHLRLQSLCSFWLQWAPSDQHERLNYGERFFAFLKSRGKWILSLPSSKSCLLIFKFVCVTKLNESCRPVISAPFPSLSSTAALFWVLATPIHVVKEFPSEALPRKNPLEPCFLPSFAVAKMLVISTHRFLARERWFQRPSAAAFRRSKCGWKDGKFPHEFRQSLSSCRHDRHVRHGIETQQ